MSRLLQFSGTFFALAGRRRGVHLYLSFMDNAPNAKNSVKTHKFMNLCDFTEFLVGCIIQKRWEGIWTFINYNHDNKCILYATVCNISMTQQISDFFQIKENEIWKLLTSDN